MTPLHRLIGTYLWFNLGLLIHEWLEPEDYWPNKDEIIEQVWGEYITKEALLDKQKELKNAQKKC